ncbi:hypothetical protein N9800_00455 [bacterium]|nr:hypothetical protein [Algibacter sp.]MDB4225711.1 hypothetical protein [bacterium]
MISIFLGTSEYTPETVHLFSDEGSVPLEVVFAVFFPAITGLISITKFEKILTDDNCHKKII